MRKIQASPQATPFAEFAVTTNFSFLRGASHPEELVAQALALGLKGIGIADRNSLAGVVRAHVFARDNEAAAQGFKLAIGARLVFCDGTPDILAFPRDRVAYSRLTRLLTCGNLKAQKGICLLTRADLLAFADGLQLIVMPMSTWEEEDGEKRATKIYEEFPHTEELAKISVDPGFSQASRSARGPKTQVFLRDGRFAASSG